MTDSKNLNLKNKTLSHLNSINVVVESANHKSNDVQEISDSLTKSISADKTELKELGGRGGLEPTRYGDWEKNGRCIDF